MTLIKSIYKNTLSPLTLTKQQELEYLEDLYKSTLEVAADRHNARHPVQVAYRISFKVADSQVMPYHVLSTDLSINGVWHNISRIGEKLDPSNRIIPRLVVYKRALAELAGHSLVFILSNKVDPMQLLDNPAPEEPKVKKLGRPRKKQDDSPQSA